jgi:4'-phosphopantetheinyl transferase
MEFDQTSVKNREAIWSSTRQGLYSAFYKGVSIYYARNSLLDNISVSKLYSVLTKEEIMRSQKMQNRQRKKTWLCSQIILRETLAAWIHIAAADIVFTRSSYGKPCIQDNPLDFNISRTKESFIFAINPYGKIGIDMEYLSGKENMDAIIEHAFSQNETQYCHCSKKIKKILEIWTAKEAFLKALGQGLIDDLKSIDIIDAQSSLLKNNNFQKKHFLCPSGEKACIVFSNYKQGKSFDS